MKKGTVLDKHFVLNEKIGEGQFAEVYAASNVKNQKQIVCYSWSVLIGRCGTYYVEQCCVFYVQVAVKVDKSRDVKILGRETAILKELQCSEFVCKLIASGKVKDGRRYCVMELLGDNLSKYMKSRKLELTEVIAIAKQILMGIRDIHSAGYVHRDIKPSNCAIRVGGRCKPRWTLLDFGLARKVIGNDGRQMPERKDTSFRGTIGYASIHAHDQRDLSWRDDLWSWFYTVVELLQGEVDFIAEASLLEIEIVACCLLQGLCHGKAIGMMNHSMQQMGLWLKEREHASKHQSCWYQVQQPIFLR